MRITIIGTGYIGLTEGLCLAYLGHDVTCVDTDKTKIEKLSKGIPTLYEEGLEDYLKSDLKNNKISFTTDLKLALSNTEVVFICVNTPENPIDGSADLKYVFGVAEEIAEKAKDNFVLVIRSTVPIGTNAEVKKLIKDKNPKLKFEIASNPEFSKQGTALKDFLHPDRIIVGTETEDTKEKMDELYKPITKDGYPIFFCNIETAELIKYASNAFLTTKIAFINELANLCEKTGANVEELAQAMGMDKRINPYFLKVGPGAGGSCFPKDVAALINIGKKYNVDLSVANAVHTSNTNRRNSISDKVLEFVNLKDLKGKKVAVLGLTFKANTDDTRYSPALALIEGLTKKGIFVNSYDPIGVPKAKEMLSKEALEKTNFFENVYDIFKDSEFVIIVTEWKEFIDLDYKKVFSDLNNKIIVDLRNILDKNKIEEIGFKYFSIGRKNR